MLEFIGAVVYRMITTKANTHQYMMQYIYYNTSSSTYLNRYGITMQSIPTCWLSYDAFGASLPSTYTSYVFVNERVLGGQIKT